MLFTMYISIQDYTFYKSSVPLNRRYSIYQPMKGGGCKLIFRRIADTISWILSALSAVDCILLIFELRNNIIVPFGTIIFIHTQLLFF